MTEAEIRAAHPDWTDEQVAAEVAKQTKPEPPKPPETGATQAEVDKAYAKLRQTESEREAERKARAEAEQKLKEREDAELSETEKLKREAEESRTAAEQGRAQLREAKLLTALADKGLTGSKASAAIRLLDGVEYGEDHQPTNLDAVLETAKGTFGEDVFAPAPAPKPPAPSIDPGTGNQPGPEPTLTAEEIAAAQRASMTPQQYEAMKGVTTFKDWQAAQARLKAPQQ
ncbi:MAG: hypothetical protein ACRDK4_04945 [Solirubrobacteraceae bacterium]